MKSNINRLNLLYDKYTEASVIIFVIVFLSLLAFQGFDVCDEGWYLTFYQQIFNNPETVEYNFVFWLTGIVGGIWFELFPNGGLLSFRFLAIFIMTFTLYIAYKIHIKYIDKKHVVLGLLMVLIINDFGYVAFYYNQLSSFLAIISIWFLFRGVKKNEKSSILGAGFFIALNVFSRLPNITLFALTLIFPIQLFWSNSLSHKYWLKQLFLFLIGAILGGVLVFILMYALDHLDIMKDSLLGLINKGKNGDSNHNLTKLLSVYKQDYFIVLKSGVKFLIILFTLIFTYKWTINKAVLKLIWSIFGVILFSYLFKTTAIYTLYFLGLLGGIGLVISKNKSKDIKILSFLALVMMITLPLGSDGGIHNVGYVSVWLIVPLFLSFLEEGKKGSFLIKSPIVEKHIKTYLKKNVMKPIINSLVLGFFLIKLFNISNEAYFDKGSRFKKVHPINSKLTNGIFTTEERAEIINDLLPELKKYVKKGDYLLAYDKIPMLNFLTETKPYMYNSWVWVYDSSTFEEQLQRAKKEIGELPIVVVQKFETIGDFSEPVPDYLSENKIETYLYKKGRVIAINHFIKRNDYSVIWSNDYFNILKSNAVK